MKMAATKKTTAKKEQRIGDELYAFMEQLFTVCRSIAGDGVRETLRQIQKYIPIRIREIQSGTKVFDWIVPDEWNIRDAWIKDSTGKKIVDFKRSNLHIVSYSVPVHQTMRLAELQKHLHTLPDHPSWIPYLTSYYTDTWGFCMAHNDFKKLREGEYEVCIDATKGPGILSYGELVLPGKTKEEFLISTYLCHPSLANDNLSGVALTTLLARELSQKTNRRYTYRFLFLPETIGTIAWLARNRRTVKHIRHGLVVTCVGDPGAPTYKKSRQGDAMIDRATSYVLKQKGKPHRIVDFFPSGSDERQYCSPGFNLPVGSLMRTMYDQFPEYHTSADNMDFVKSQALGDSFALYNDIINLIEHNETFLGCCLYGEPQLGKRGIYPLLGGTKNTTATLMALMWVLNLSDGSHSLLDIAERSGIPFDEVRASAEMLRKAKLLRLQAKKKTYPVNKQVRQQNT
jgi:aminopeptidase-like protein